MKTYIPKKDDIQRKWYVVDATDVVLGRLSTEVASILRGKNKPMFTPNADVGDYVIVINAEKVKLTGKKLIINVEEIKFQDLDAQLVAENIASQLERRISFRRAMKQTMQRSMRAGALGIKTMVSGRLGGADMARSEGYNEGKVPLQTLRADVDYGFAEANTTYGKIGCKVWIYKGEVLNGKLPEVKPADDGKKRRRKRFVKGQSNK